VWYRVGGRCGLGASCGAFVLPLWGLGVPFVSVFEESGAILGTVVTLLVAPSVTL
jgi:hypothetical protein